MSSGISQAITITRPANTTAYGAGDVVGNSTAAGGGILEFTNMGSGSNSRLYLTSTQFRVDLSSVPSGMTYFTLHLYNASPGSAYADNDPWDLPSGDRAAYLGYIVLGTPVDLGATLYVEQNLINKEVRLRGTSIYAYLVTATGYTPASGTTMGLNALALGMW